MRKIYYYLLFCIVAGCGISDDCITSSGDVKTKDVSTVAFDKIFVYPGISLVVTQGDAYSVTIEAGENFIDEISATLEGTSLTLKDNSGCNWVRDYGQTIVHVTAPNIEEIYSNTEQPIRSNGVLTFPTLRLFSMDFFGGVGTGDFMMEVDNQQLVVQSNHVSAFFITGHTNQMLLNFYNGTGRFEGRDLIAEDIVIFQRGANDMIIHPVVSLSGDIYSTGNVISVTHPPTVNVIEHYSGRLIFE